MYDNYNNRSDSNEPWNSNSHQPQPTYTTTNFHVEDAPGSGGPTPPKKKHMTAGKIVALCLCCSLVGGAVGAGGVVLGNQLTGGASNTSNVLEGNRTVSAINVSQIDTSKEMTAAEVYAANVNSTVGITTSIVTTNWWGIPTQAAAAGSGFIYSDDGYIVTNYHVIEGATSVTVNLYDGSSYEASLVGYDASNDIAVLKIDATGLTPVVLGNSDSVNVGDSVVAIGNPLGELTFSLTSGSISALNREVTLSSSNSTTGTITMDLMQTDCAINSGNSGGALFNMYGEVIGITNAKYSSSGSSSEASIDNIGFAIPINHARSIVDSIIEKGYIATPYVGVTVKDVSTESQNFGLPQGAAVNSVVDGSPAAEAGLQTNDIITKVNDTEITGSDDLVDVVKACEAGDKLTMTVYRSGETLTITVTVGEQKTSAMGEESNATQESYQQSQQYPSNGGGYSPWGYSFGY